LKESNRSVAREGKEDLMEQQGVLLRGIARVLNAGGSALVDIYDAATSIKTSVLSGEKGNLKARLKEYEKKMERLYYEIGKEVALSEFTTQTSAAGEAGIKLVAEHRVEIEKIKQRIKEIEEEEKAAKEAASDRAGARAKPAPEPIEDAGKPAVSEAPEASEVSTGPVTEEVTEKITEEVTEEVTEEIKEIVTEAAETQAQEIDTDRAESAEPEAGEVSPGVAMEEVTEKVSEEVKVIVAEAAETPEHELQKDTTEFEAPVDGEASIGAETKEEVSTEVLETMLKADLLKLCMEKGIEADKRMTKTEIIALILGD
jgi:hypothetical protein